MSQIEEATHAGDSRAEPEILLTLIRQSASKQGERYPRLAQLLERYRNYLTVLARTELATNIRARVDASDVVQDTFIEAHRDFDGFRGTTEKELIAWLSNALRRNILDQVKRQRAAKRDYRREQTLNANSDGHLGGNMLEFLGADDSSPSQHASRREQSVLLADALANLPVEYQNVIVYRNFNRWPFEQIAQQIGKSPGATRMIWLRALEQLRKAME